jgi:hypothetical protein
LKEGEAAEWNIMEYQARKDWEDYDDFISDLRARFGDHDLAYTAQEKMQKLQQTGSVEKYNTEFKKIMQITQYSMIKLIEKHKKGLKDGIVLKIYNNELLHTLHKRDLHPSK